MRKALLVLLITLTSLSFAYGQERTETSAGRDELWIRDLERRLGDAITRMDRAEVSRLLADDFITTGSNSEIGDKAQTLKTLGPYPDIKVSFEIDDINVRLYEGTTAIVTGRDILKFETRERTVKVEYRYTRIYIKREGRWQLVAQHVTQIPDKRQ